MVVSPVVAHSLETVGSHADYGRGPACALCQQPKLGAQHKPDCPVRIALNRPGDPDLARAALQAAAHGDEDDNGRPRCTICLTPPGLRHALDCVVGHGLFTLDCLEQMAG